METLPRPAELAAMLNAKLCHDLISPTSAIVSGVDLIEDPDSQDMREDALNLVISSSRKLGALLQFCRVAYGASAAADTFDVRDLEKLAQGYFETQKAELDWALSVPSVGKPAARALLNLAQLGAGCLPRGGVARLADEGSSIVLTATGLRATLRPEIARALAGEPLGEGLGGHWVQAYYVHLFVGDAGGRVFVDVADEKVTFVATLSV